MQKNKMTALGRLTMQFNSQITFHYYKDLPRACKFYEEVFGLELEIDQGWAKIYKVSESAFIGLVDEKRGYFNWVPDKSSMVTLVTSDVDPWYDRIRHKGVNCFLNRMMLKKLGFGVFLWKTQRAM
ncbi:MAG: VOC family protein [Candidatus Heimdallarchaeota archaeon]